jgi:hypothetical protein
MTLILEENEANDSDEDVFFMPPNSPTYLKPTMVKNVLLSLLPTPRVRCEKFPKKL